MYNKVNSFNGKISHTIIENKDSLSNIAATNDEIFMSLAKLDHIVWKVNTYISILEEKPTFKFVDHHNCRLGKWYYEGEGHNHFSKLNSFSKIESVHSQVHNGTKQIFNFLDDVELNIDKIIDGAHAMEKASSGVFRGLDEILNEKKSKRNIKKVA